VSSSPTLVRGLVAVLAVTACTGLIAVVIGQGLGRAALWAGVVGALAGIAAAAAAVWPLIPRRPLRSSKPRLRKGLVSRPKEMAKLVEALTSGKAAGITTALHGAGGFGKSTLAEMVAASPEVRKRFKGGVDTFTVGRGTRGPARIAEKVNEVITWLPGEHKYFSDPDQAAQELGALLDTGRPRLLILDDVWEPAQLRPFIQGGRQCARLVTTRDPGLLADLGVAGEVIEVDRMSPEQAREVLTYQLPQLDPALTEDLVAVTGRWPLLLALVNKILITAAVGQDVSQAGRDLIARLRAGGPADVDKLRKVTDVDPDEPKQRAESVHATIEASTELLEAVDTDLFRELAVFAENEAVPVDLVALLWQATAGLDLLESAQLCDRLASLAQVSLPPAGTNGGVALHGVIRDFMREKLGPQRLTALHGVLLDALAAKLGAAELPDAGADDRDLWGCLAEHVTAPGHTDYPLAMRTTSGPPGGEGSETGWWNRCAEYIGEYCVRHLVEAGRRQQAEDLACDVRWVLRRLEARGAAPVLADLAEVGTDRALELRGIVDRFAHMLGWDTARPDAGQILLNVLRQEPQWASQAVSLQAGVLDPILVSQWPLPDNPGPALRHVYKVPSPKTDSQAMALSFDGSWLAVAANDYPDSAYTHAMSLILMAANGYGGSDIVIFDTSTGSIRSTVRSDNPIRRMTISPDGRQIAAIGHGTLACFDAETGSVVSESHDHEHRSPVGFTPDGALITIADYGRVALWDAANGQRISSEHGDDFSTFCHDPPRLRESVDAVASADGAWVIAGGRYGVFTWTIPDGQQLKAFNVDGYAPDDHSLDRPFIWRVVAAPDRSWVAGSSDETIYVWATDTEEMIAKLDASGRLTALAVSPDGSLLASGDHEGTVLVWETRRFTLTARLGRHAGMSSLAFSPDGQLLYSGGGGEARAWQLSMATSCELPPEGIPAETVVMSPTGAWVAVATQGGDVHIRKMPSGQELATLAGHAVSAHIAIAPDGTWLATQAGGTISVWDGDWTLARRFHVGAETGEINSIHASADSRQLLTVDAIAVRAWNPRSGKQLATMAHFTEGLESLTFSQDGSWLAAGDYYGTIWVWDAQTGDLRATLGGGYNHASCTALTAAPDDRLLGRAYRTIETWDVQKGVLADAIGFPGGSDVAISPDGGCVIDGTGSLGGTGSAIVRYDLDPAEPRRFTRRGVVGHIGWHAAPSLAFSGDGRWFAIGLDDAVEVWDRSAHRVRARSPENDHRPIALSFRGDKVAYASYDGIAILNVSTSEVVQELRLAKKKYDSFHISSLAISPDDGWLAIVSGDKVGVVDMTSGDVRYIVGDLGTIRAAAFSPSGQYAAIAGSEGGRVWDSRTARPLAGSRWQGAADSLLFGPADEWLAIGAGRGVTIFALPGGERLHEFAIPHMGQDGIRRMLSIPHGAQIIIQSWASLIIADLNNETLATIDTGRDAIDVMAISPDGRWLATGGQDLAVLSLRDGSLVTSHPFNRPVKSIDWSPASDSIVAGGDGGAYLLQFKNRPE